LVERKFPGTQIMALNTSFDTKLKGADHNIVFNGPEEFLAPVAAAAE